MLGKYFIRLLCLLLSTMAIRIAASDSLIRCHSKMPIIPTQWTQMERPCEASMTKQIEIVVNASYVYMAMGVFFTKDTINRPNIAIQFYKASKNKRKNAISLIDYLSMRGQLASKISDLIKMPNIEKSDWEDGAHALDDALKMESDITRSIRDTIKVCERASSDYHLIDYLSGVYLEEQLKWQRELAGQLSTLKKMMDKNGALGEFLFDKDM